MIHRFSSNYVVLARHILEAMGLGSAAVLALVAPACGGNVVVDEPVASSGAGGGSGSTGNTGGPGSVSSSASTGTGPPSFMCDVPIDPSYSRVYGCFVDPNGCPPAGSSTAFGSLSGVLNISGACPDNPDFCWCETTVVAVPCGPDPMGAGCCYYADVITSKLCEGRPFMVGGAARTAEIIARGDWQACVQPELASLDPSDRRALADAWAADARHEHASIASFARFVLELVSIGAPSDLVRAAQQAIAEEIRHAELCFGLASALSGEPLGPGPLAMGGALVGRGSMAEIAAAVVREGCIGETLSALGALSARDGATDPAVRAALDEISADEASHAALAWRAAAWMWEHGDSAVREAIARAFAETAPIAPEERLGDMDPGLARAFGRLAPAELREVIAQGFAQVVRPCAEVLVNAADPTGRRRARSARLHTRAPAWEHVDLDFDAGAASGPGSTPSSE